MSSRSFSQLFRPRRPRRGLSVTVTVALLGAARTAAAEPGDEVCQTKCPNIPPPKAGWTTNTYVQCVEYTKHRSSLKDKTGDAHTWNDFPECAADKPTATCIRDTAALGAIVVSEANQNGAYGAGHVAVVECMVGDWAKVSEYNFGQPGGTYRGDRCINIKAAKERGTPYSFLYPDGQPVKLLNERCNDPIAIKTAFVRPSAEKVENGTVLIDFAAASCSRAKFTLYRNVYKVEGKNRVLIPEKSQQVEVKDVLSPFLDTFEGVPACSEFEYRLHRDVYIEPKGGAVSAWFKGVNLAPPTNFRVDPVAANYGKVVLRWKSACGDYAGDHPTEYEINYSRGAGKYPTIKTKGTVVADVLRDREFPLGNLYGATSYHFEINTYNYGDRSATADKFDITTNGPTPNTPPLPQRPALKMLCDAGKLRADWVAARPGIGYELGYIPPYKGVKPALAILKTSGTSVDIPAAQDGDYLVYLRTVGADNKASAWTELVTFARDCNAEPPVLLPLTNDKCAGVKLTWNAPVDATVAHLKQYEVMRQPLGDNPGPAVPVGRTLANVRTITDPAADPNKVYRYTVHALYRNAQGEDMRSPASNYSDAVQPTSPPAAPNILSVDTDLDRVHLEFTDQSTNETHFVIKRWTVNETGALATYTLPSKPGKGAKIVWDDPGPLPLEDRNYVYRVFAAKGDCKDTTLTPSLPVNGRRMRPPVNVAAVADGSGTRIKWQDTNVARTQFAVYRRKLDEPAWKPTPIGTVPASQLYFVDPESVDAQYRVQALLVGDRMTSDGPLSLPVTYLRAPVKACPPGGVKPELTRVTNLDLPWRSELTFSYAAGANFVTRVEALRTGDKVWSALTETTAKSGTVDVDVSPYMNQQLALRLVGRDTVNNCMSPPSATVTAYPLPAPTQLPTVPADKSCPKGLLVKWLDNSKYGTKMEVQFSDDGDSWQKMPKEDFYRITGTWEVRQCDTPLAASADRQYRVRSTYRLKDELMSASLWSNEKVAAPAGEELALSNGTMEVASADAKPGARIQYWGPGGAWALHTTKEYERPGRPAPGDKFGYYAAGDETVGQELPALFEAGKTYTFRGYVTGGGDNKGTVPFQIGYLADPEKSETFKAVATQKYSAGASWVNVKGVSFKVPGGDPSVGKRIMVRLGGGADGGSSDIWFDNLVVTVSAK